MHDKKIEPVLTDYDITINSIHRENMFKGTITVCIVYAIFAFILIAIAYFSDNIRDLLFDRFLPFTLIYIIGTIIIILIFIYYIVSFVPKKIDKNKLDNSISCPDYWKLEILDDNIIDNNFDTTNYNKKLFKYRCVMDDNVFNKGAIYKQDLHATDTTLQYKLGNKPAIVTLTGKTNGKYNDTYNNSDETDKANLTKFLTEENDKYYHLYKDINKFKNYNLIYTNNRIASSNIQKDLIEAALIMNNYEKKPTSDASSYYYQDKLSITTPSPINPALSSSTGLKNYLNSPNNLTWASTLSTTAADVAFDKDDSNPDINYLSVVYDWSTFDPILYNDKHGKTATNVYALDETITSAANFAKVGRIEYENGNYIFKSLTDGITISNTLFGTKISDNNNYYLDKTIIKVEDTLSGYQNPTDAEVVSGPKIRLYNKTERPIQIPKQNAIDDQIPLTCSSVYPSLLASKEDRYSENNTLRCAYSKICNIPWSDLHCNDITLNKYS